MGCAFGQGQLNQSEGESEWGVHSDRSGETRRRRVRMEWSFGQGTVNTSEGESEWGVHSDRSGETRRRKV
jgi:hypothetical protein